MALQAASVSSSDLSSTRRCFLLDIPGEIRNRIYDIALDDRHVLFTPRRTNEPIVEPAKVGSSKTHAVYLAGISASNSTPGEFPFTIKESDDERRSRKAIRQFRSLTQVCRKIRSEYLPLYQRRTTYRICHLDLQRYLDQVLREECARAARQHIAGLYDPLSDHIAHKEYEGIFLQRELAHRSRLLRNILVDCKSWEEKVGLKLDHNGRHNSSIDLLPFLKFCITAPGIRVQCGFNACKCCEHDWSGLKDHLNALFDVYRHPKLRAWLEESVCAVKLRWPPSLTFELTKGQGRKWMGDWNDGSATEPLEMRRWMDEVGLRLDRRAHGSLGFLCFKSDWEQDYGLEEEDDEIVDDKPLWNVSGKGSRKKKQRGRGSRGKKREEKRHCWKGRRV